jgi:hypothetical protein
MAEQGGEDPTDPEGAQTLISDLIAEGCTPEQAGTAVQALAAEEH